MRKPREERADDILSAARSEFADKGYEAASVAGIAQRAGIVEGTIYKHFKSKRALLFRVTREFYEPVIEQLDHDVRGIAGARNQLRFLVGRLLHALTRDEGLSRVVIREIRAHDAEYRATVSDLQRRYTGVLSRILADGVAAGELRADVSTRMVRDVLNGAVEHLVWKAVNAPEAFDHATAADELIDVIMLGAAAPTTETHRMSGLMDRLEQLLERTGNTTS